MSERLKPSGTIRNDEHAAEVDADVLERRAVHGHRRGHLDVGVVEGRQLLFPVGGLELEEERPQRAEVVYGLVPVGLDLRRRQRRPRRRARQRRPMRPGRVLQPPIAARAARRSAAFSRLSPSVSNRSTTFLSSCGPPKPNPWAGMRTVSAATDKPATASTSERLRTIVSCALRPGPWARGLPRPEP